MSASQNNSLADVLLTDSKLIIRQKKSWMQILTNFEVRNKYELYDQEGKQIGWIIEEGNGLINWLKRIILRSHRPFRCSLRDLNEQVVITFHRSFFWFFSDLFVSGGNGQALGSAHRRFAFLSKRYDLRDVSGNNFALINSGFFRIWTFRVLGRDGQEKAVISKKWGGALKEFFTDADTFAIEFMSNELEAHERAVIIGVAISLDFDFFERNNSNMLMSKV